MVVFDDNAPSARRPSAAIPSLQVPSRRSLPVGFFTQRGHVAGSTLIAEAGANVAVISTALPDVGLTLHSTYSGAPGVPTAVVHLALGPGPTAQHVAELDEDAMPVVGQRHRCVPEHYAEVVARAAELGHELRIEVDDHALELARRRQIAGR